MEYTEDQLVYIQHNYGPTSHYDEGFAAYTFFDAVNVKRNATKNKKNSAS
jgi:hypothetical protein